MKLCFLTVAYGSHETYEELFRYSIKQVYPDADVLILPNEFLGYEVSSARTAAMWRFLYFTSARVKTYLQGYDYFYITDVDFIICPEQTSLVEQHLQHCETIGLPYSAHMRSYEPKIVAARLFTTREYVSRVAAVTTVLDMQVRTSGEAIFHEKPRHPDERLLYKIIRLSGLAAPPQLKLYTKLKEFNLMNPANSDQQLFSPHHGIHLGMGRKSPSTLHKTYHELFEMPFYQEYLAYARSLSKKAEFQAILSRMTPKTVATVERMLNYDSIRYSRRT
jgi:hypothetical protein